MMVLREGKREANEDECEGTVTGSHRGEIRATIRMGKSLDFKAYLQPSSCLSSSIGEFTNIVFCPLLRSIICMLTLGCEACSTSESHLEREKLPVFRRKNQLDRTLYLSDLQSHPF